jgi:hypothetical protein
MGINAGFAALLVRARAAGVDFTETVTIGRQSLRVPEEDLRGFAARLRAPAPGASLLGARFAEPFLIELLGARTVQSIDYADYQEASIVHDLNTPIPADLRRRYNALIDGGSLEHIFDVRQALANYMTLVREGGSLFLFTPANNLCGHGFYQFSPEFFFRVFSPGNGFAIESVTMVETPLLSVEASRERRYFETVDPEVVGKRVLFMGTRPVMAFVHARCVTACEPFVRSPLQSDYRRKWRDGAAATAAARTEGTATGPEAPFRHVSSLGVVRRRLRQRRKNALANRRWFRPYRP